jgi:hypothetical protein
VARDRFVAVFSLAPIAAGSPGPSDRPCNGALPNTLGSPLLATLARWPRAQQRRASALRSHARPPPRRAQSRPRPPATTAPNRTSRPPHDGRNRHQGWPGGWRRRGPRQGAVYTADPEGGLVLADGTVPVLDGIAVLGTEPRAPEDIAAFELPPTGYDPYMFRIEPEPLRDRRPASRLPRWAIPSAARSAWAGDASGRTSPNRPTLMACSLTPISPGAPPP